MGWKAPCREPKETAGGRPGGRPGTAGGKAVYGCGEKGTSPSWWYYLVCPIGLWVFTLESPLRELYQAFPGLSTYLPN